MFIEFLYTSETFIPIWQIMLLLLFSTMSLVSGRVKLGLLINYLFTLYWGYIANRDYIFAEFEQAEQIASVYFGIGIALAVLAALGFLMQKD
jgi:hypothetical protein